MIPPMNMQPTGFLNIHKPKRVTSHGVVARVRRIIGTKKVGHAGTLDPLATGVLILCIGSAARLSEYVMHQTKRYRARLRFGQTTDTYDSDGVMLTERPWDHLTRAQVEAALPAFTGEFDQLPPMYSAIKQDGRKLYDLARAGITVERQPRRVTIHTLTLIEWMPPECVLDVSCSAGTYIRSLAHDLGESLGVGAHLTGLIRTSSGQFRLEDALLLDVLAAADDPRAYLISPRAVLGDFPSITLSSDEVTRLIQGKLIDMRQPTDQPIGDGVIAMGYNHTGELVAVLEARDGMWKPAKVLAAHQST